MNYGKSNNLSNEEQVTPYLNNLQHPLADVVKALRTVVLASDASIGELIKWNSLSFEYTGQMQPFDPKEYKRDIVVFNLHKKDFVLLVFPTGARINNITGLLEGNFTDGRRTAKFANAIEVRDRAADLKLVINEWLNGVE